ncbi:phosphonate ABC transporter, permease protein PhnE [Pseudomonas schmalbachii]|uniref:Phosphonate ABC transporter, permease protein PhnE n=1 Tax=Pseudomonas schmalbachii TaxID=2816993 RepID=A0ABS3TQ81_9PSED|nr:phosphonate ABC transporter, permease protein PhnE [Pseudomonas schmalbachii]MBO3275808.1 phosphonate ABC transporter, permease protein PhnE [Pseudomonas schmalbachii]
MQNATPLDTSREPTGKPGWLSLLGWGSALAVLGWSWQGAEIAPLTLLNNAGNIAELGADFFPPSLGHLGDYIRQMLATIQLAIWGTLLAVLFGVPCGLLCAQNIAPWWINQPVRRLMDACRAINELVFAMLFVVAVGLGPFAGVLALFIHTTGVLAKLFSEQVEAIEPGPVEGVRATGAGRLEEIIYGVLPQVLPLWISVSLYRFESNLRSATVVGMVGAGGIGVVLWETMRAFDYRETTTILLVIIVSVSVLDLLSQRIRKRFI